MHKMNIWIKVCAVSTRRRHGMNARDDVALPSVTKQSALEMSTAKQHRSERECDLEAFPLMNQSNTCSRNHGKR